MKNDEARTKAPHTPGPWDTTAGKTREGDWIVKSFADNNRFVAHVLDQNEYALDAQVEANALRAVIAKARGAR